MSETILKKRNLFAILMLAFVWYIESAIVGPGLGLIAQAFPTASQLAIQYIFTAPYITCIIFSIITGKLVKYFDKKSIVVFGLFLYGITGVLPAFCNSVSTILILRLLTGIGVGLVMPIGTMYIAEYYSGSKRERLFGYATSISNVACLIGILIVGALLVNGWQFSFYALAVVFVIAILAIAFLPKSPPRRQPANTENQSTSNTTKAKMPAIVFILAVLMALLWMFYGFFTGNGSLYLIQNNLASVFMVGIVLMLPGAGSMIAGLFYGQFSQLLKKSLVVISLFLYGLGFALYVASYSLTLICIGSFISGFGAGLLVPFILEMTAKKTLPQQHDMAFGVVTGFIPLGAILFPFVQLGIQTLGHDTSLKFLFTVTYIIIFIAAIINLVFLIAGKNKKAPVNTGENKF